LAWSVGFTRRLRMPVKAVVAYPAQPRGPYKAALADALREAASKGVSTPAGARPATHPRSTVARTPHRHRDAPSTLAPALAIRGR
jgi:hypothetical protein